MLHMPRSAILLVPIISIVSVISCSTLTPSTGGDKQPASATVTPPIGATAGMPTERGTRSPQDTSDESPCPIDDVPFCDFVSELQPLVETSDIDGILARTQQYDCVTSGGFHPGWDPEVECSQDAYCVHSGALGGEGGCTPLSSFQNRWNSRAANPLALRGIVYPSIPGLGLESVDELSGPAILVTTGDPEWDWILFCKLDAGQWSISAIVMQRRSAAKYMTPEDMVIPWH